MGQRRPTRMIRTRSGTEFSVHDRKSKKHLEHADSSVELIAKTSGAQSAEVKSLNAKITQNTQLLDLTREERDLMSRHWTSEALQQFVKEAYDKSQRKPRSKTYERLRSFLYDFSGVAGQICGVVSAAIPSGSEYTAALAATAVLCKVSVSRCVHVSSSR